MFKSTTIVFLWSLVVLQCISAASSAAEPISDTRNQNNLFGRVFRSLRSLFGHISNKFKMAWNHLVKAAMKMGKGGSHHHSGALSSSETTTTTTPATDHLAPYSSDPVHNAHRPGILKFRLEDDIDLVIADSFEYEVVDDFVVTGYGISDALEAIRNEHFLDRICINGAESVSKGPWEAEGAWSHRSVHGKQKSVLIQPLFIQIHRFGYTTTRSSAVYVVNQEVEVMKARFQITLKIQLDLDTSGVRIRISFKVDSSGPWIIRYRGTPHARHYARLDYQQARSVLINILHGAATLDDDEDNVAASSSSVDQIRDPTDLLDNGLGLRSVLAVSIYSTTLNLNGIRSVLVCFLAFALAIAVMFSQGYTSLCSLAC